MLPHRLGLSETVLVFKQHLKFPGGVGALFEGMTRLRAEGCEKKIITAGGINHGNAAKYAASDVHVIATSCIFHAKPLDMEARMERDCEDRDGAKRLRIIRITKLKNQPKIVFYHDGQR